ncbi:hypothetical protein MC885_000570 [Smutsia gigantea]|nr:hypothetical protein MC885_000570 [Smutsia gigantea]
MTVLPHTHTHTHAHARQRHVSENVTVTALTPTAKPSTTPVSLVSKNVTVTTLKSTAASKMTTPGLSTNTTSITSKSTPKITTPKITSASQNTSQLTTTHNSSVTSISSSVTSFGRLAETSAAEHPQILGFPEKRVDETRQSLARITATINSKENKGSKFDSGSFVGGIVLTLGILSVLYIGCKMYYSRRGIRYRTMQRRQVVKKTDYTISNSKAVTGQ